MDIFKKYNAKAIWIDEENKINRYVKFQTEFSADNAKDVSFYICTDTDYELYINGKLAGFGQYEDFPDKKVYNTHNVSSFIKDGVNLVSLLCPSIGEDTQSHLAGLPMVIFAAADGENCLLASSCAVKCAESEDCRSGKVEQITCELPHNIGIDFTKDDGYRTKNVSKNWRNAVEVDDSYITYVSRPIALLQLGDVVTGKIISHGVFIETQGETYAERMHYAGLAHRWYNDCFDKTEDGSLALKQDNTYWIIDLGEEMVGYITLDIEAEEGAELIIGYGEHLADMRVRAYIDKRNYAFPVKLRDGRQQITFCTRRIAGRYLEIFSYTGIKKIYTIGLTDVRYPIEYRCPLKLNDTLFNQIYKVSQHTLDLCMHSHYEDCPQREQSLYGMDSRNQMLAGYYAFGETSMPRASLELFAQGQMENGLFQLCAPATYERTIPYFSLAWACSLHEYVLFSGDKDFFKEMMPAAKKLLRFFKLDEKENLILRPQGYQFWNFYEWTEDLTNWPDEPEKKIDAPLNAFYVKTLRKYAELCSWCGEDEEFTWATGIINKIQGAFHNAFYCPDKKAYKSYIYFDECTPHQFSQLTQSWALWADLVPEEFKKDIRKWLVSEEFHSSSLSHCVFNYDVLMEEPETYSEYVLNDIGKQWGYMLYSGATSFWENIEGPDGFNLAGSLCHGWSATPAYIFWRYILGIYPTAPGFSEFEINPVCGNDFIATGKLKTPQGILSVHHKNGETTFSRED